MLSLSSFCSIKRQVLTPHRTDPTMIRSKSGLNWLVMVLCLLTVTPHCFADEGMFPVSELGALDLQSKGLKLSSDEVFNTDAIGLVWWTAFAKSTAARERLFRTRL